MHKGLQLYTYYMYSNSTEYYCSCRILLQHDRQCMRARVLQRHYSADTAAWFLQRSRGATPRSVRNGPRSLADGSDEALYCAPFSAPGVLRIERHAAHALSL